MFLLDKIFGNYSDKELKRIKPLLAKIESFEPSLKAMTDDELKNQTVLFRERLENGETLDDLLPEAFATVREASVRTTGMRHFDVQILGGIILHQGRIAEMRTGEGKTLVSTLPAYLNALTGNGVHIVTVNDYLAKRDSEEMGVIHRFLGLTVGCILSDMEKSERQEAYNCDITYATNNELGFDYLRDNMVVYKEHMVQQKGLTYTIIDEIDSVLIDEARTPLIISGKGNESTKLYEIANFFVKGLEKGQILNEEEALNPLMRTELEEEGDFVIDEKTKSVSLTAQGIEKAENYFKINNYSDPAHYKIQHHVQNALKANYTMFLDQNYVVQDEEIVIVDEFTGRLMPGRRYSDGLHQAIEAKESVTVQQESKTLATVTFQNFFNKYTKKSGMTGTALTEESEFREIYGLDVVVIPTNRPIQRIDKDDLVFRTISGKTKAIVNDVADCYERKQPVLVGTITIEKSEELSKALKQRGIPHNVLNAKYHEQEAEIVSKAGQIGAVTIATNMAGRGTDIKLEEGVEALGGLKIVGTERHDSRRIDNQLRGRSGRQGDPGESRFYLSMEDDLLRLFGADRVAKVVDALGMDEDEPIETKILSNSIENAQKKVEGNNFSTRKHLLDYDRVMNEQREVIYGERLKVLLGENMKESIFTMIKASLSRTVEEFCVGDYPEEWNFVGLNEKLMPMFHTPVILIQPDEIKSITKETILDRLVETATKLYEEKETNVPEEQMREIERIIVLKFIDSKWMEHLDNMDHMRQGISLRAYAQKDPVIEYKLLSYDMFEDLGHNIQDEVAKAMMNFRVQTQEMKREQVLEADMINPSNPEKSTKKTPKKNADVKIGRNDPCPCGSGKKYKNCHGLNN